MGEYHGIMGFIGLPRLLSGKESTCNADDAGDMGSIPRLGRFPGGGHGNPLQYSCLRNPMDRVHGIGMKYFCKVVESSELGI